MTETVPQIQKENSHKPIKIGIVRPISTMDQEHTEQHWEDVHTLIEEALSNDDQHIFEINLVSETQDADIIQATIIQNLFESDVVICDMTLHNPNVFFELGLRIAFRKPCIVIQEEGRNSPFDVSSIRYISYPCKLAYVKAVEFQKQLRKTVLKTHEAYINNGEVSTDPLFSKARVEYKTELTEIDQTSVEFVMNKLEELQTAVMNIQNIITVPNDDLGLRNFEIMKQDLFFIIEKEFELAMQHSVNRQEYIERTRNIILDKLRRLRKDCSIRTYNDIRVEVFDYIKELSSRLR
ncbi:hypothetical protein [Rodentibacter ratti]|uniref:RNA helicase n=1 Tax=Rodentibacter ratti TaxID=1906745 RepID=A0A1V3L5G0_9PAST|nr:hypothetical protein [Rodentibacter ratti]OOF85176.1 hypothetical protein BKG88_08710 [Rodentibacter ratti]